MKTLTKIISCSLLTVFSSLSFSFAATLAIPMQLLTPNTPAKGIGIVTATDTQYGLLLTPDLHGLTPGLHGFHIHVNPACSEQGQAAGGHLDPNNTGKHLGPYNNNGHLGDLPALYVDPQGNATLPVLAPRLKVKDLYNHALMIHAGGDNYSDHPEKLGGGGARMACGVIYQK